MKTIVFLYIVTAVFIVTAATVHAQPSGIKPGDRVRVLAPSTSEKPLIGNITSISSDDIFVIRNDGYFYFPLTSIERLDVSLYSRKRPLRGLTIGALSLGTFAGAGWAVTYRECTPRKMFDCFMHPSNRGQAFLMGGISGGMIGGILGLIIGSTINFDKWKRVSLGVNQPVSHAYLKPQPGVKFEYRFR